MITAGAGNGNAGRRNRNWWRPYAHHFIIIITTYRISKIAPRPINQRNIIESEWKKERETRSFHYERPSSFPLGLICALIIEPLLEYIFSPFISNPVLCLILLRLLPFFKSSVCWISLQFSSHLLSSVMQRYWFQSQLLPQSHVEKITKKKIKINLVYCVIIMKETNRKYTRFPTLFLLS